MKKIISFGEDIKGYDIKVLNEREVRAGAGILFVIAMGTFLTAWLTGNFYPTKIFVIGFMVDFIIRIFINPRYSPSLILGKIATANQIPEYVGAPQKKFAWSIGLGLSLLMFFLIVVNGVIGPINLLICISCLVFLFFESAFGICLGCKMYNLFHKDSAKLCPGGVCEVHEKEEIQKVGNMQFAVLALFLIIMFFVPSFIKNKEVREIVPSSDISGTGDCTVPDWAKKIGHGDQWKLHNGCKKN
jgi:hypothetical protein